MKNISFTSFTHDSPLYEQSLLLRNRVLIKSVGRHENCRDFDYPEKDIYLIGMQNNNIVSTAIMTPLDENTVQMRQVAVHENLQGQGVGSAIIKMFEDLALEKGYTNIILHARDTAVNFYENLGYKAEGDFFYEIEIAHIEMHKKLIK